jgi:uncharacterized cupredoxin-like copper-binding protein
VRSPSRAARQAASYKAREVGWTDDQIRLVTGLSKDGSPTPRPTSAPPPTERLQERVDGYADSVRCKRVWTAAIAGLTAVVVTAGCGSSGSSASSQASIAASVPQGLSSAASSAVSGAAEGHVVEIDVADSGLAFVKTSATASAGPVVIRSMNPQSTGHDIALKGNGVDETGDIVSDGGVSTITIADLQPGSYTFYCSVPGHEQAGMKGTLTVS